MSHDVDHGPEIAAWILIVVVVGLFAFLVFAMHDAFNSPDSPRNKLDRLPTTKHRIIQRS